MDVPGLGGDHPGIPLARNRFGVERSKQSTFNVRRLRHPHLGKMFSAAPIRQECRVRPPVGAPWLRERAELVRCIAHAVAVRFASLEKTALASAKRGYGHRDERRICNDH